MSNDETDFCERSQSSSHIVVIKGNFIGLNILNVNTQLTKKSSIYNSNQDPKYSLSVTKLIAFG